MEWYLKVLQNYVGFQGRARREEYWMFYFFNIIMLILHATIDLIADLSSILIGLYTLITLLPSLAVGARRLHDTGRSGWWQLISIIPLIGIIILLIFMCKDSQENNNQYGPSPKFSSSH
ncbi:hypothetical protein CN424_19525 [Bacillus cereus]|nr:hypothetical protein CN424_19525 [Bacillus cereus]